MKKLKAFYFSGTGNTKYVTDEICKRLGEEYLCDIFDITSKRDFSDEIVQADLILIAYPIYGSAPPIPMRDFFGKYCRLFKDKRFAIAVTQYFFSGDGAATLGRFIEKAGGKVLFAEHFNMPNNLADMKIFKIRNGEENRKKLLKADKKIDKFTIDILNEKSKRRGFNFLSHGIGYYSQRVFWLKHEDEKRNKLKVDNDLCVGCGICVKNCPSNNIEMENGKAKGKGNCIFCYCCVNRCPKSAIRLLGKKPPDKKFKGVNKGI